MSMSVNNRSASAQGSSAAGAIDGQDVKAAGKGKGPEREVDAEGKPVLPWAFIDCDTDDLVVLIAHMLNKLMEHNDQVVLTSSSLTRFHSRAPPAITVIDYLRRIVKYTNLERLPLLSLLAYIDITCTSLPTFTLSSLTVHRFLIAGVTAGSKALCDVFCTNAHYAKVGGIKVNELNALERELVKVTDWNLCVHAELLQQYYSSLIRSHGQYAQSAQPPDPPFTAFPLPEPEKGIFDELEAELEQAMRVRAGRDGKNKNPLESGRESPEDTEMDDSPLAGEVISMQVDEEAKDIDPSEGDGLNSVQPAKNGVDIPYEPAASSPISSDVEPSSQSGGSEASSNGAVRDSTAIHQHDAPIPNQTANVTITSATTSRTTSAYSSPRSHPSGSGSALSASLKSTTSGGRRKSTTSGVPFPILMTSSPASPRMDSTPAEAEDMLGIVSASDVHTYVSDTARGPSIPQGKISAEPAPSPRMAHPDGPPSERIDSAGQARARRVSSPEHTFRDSPSSGAIPIASSSRRPDFTEPFAGSLTRSSSTEQSKSISSQRFKRFMGSLFRSKSVSSTDSTHPMDRDDAMALQSGSARNHSLATVGETRSPRRAQSMIPSVPPEPTAIPRHSSKPDAPGSYTKSPSAMSGHSSAHPGSVTPRIRTRSERSVSPGRATYRQTTTTDVEMELDEKEAESDAGDAAYPLKRVKSTRDQTAVGSAASASSVAASGGPGIDWKCRPTGSAGLDGVVTGLGLG